MSVLSHDVDPKSFGNRIQAERKARGQTQSDVATLLGVARTTVVAVEKGERGLSSTEIIRLSEKWNIAVSDLVRERAVVEPLAPQLRAATPKNTLAATEIEELWDSAETLRKLGENYLEMENRLGNQLKASYPPIYSTGAMPIAEAASDIAFRERQRLGISDLPVPHLRSVLENEVGLRIFLIKMPSRIAGMFAFDEQLGGCIALNAAHPTERRLWTLAHEYYHFLVDRYQADVCSFHGTSPRRVGESEKLADAFAGHFLMPASGIRRRFYDIKSSKPNGAVTTGDLLHLKRQYGVSFSALILRLEELKLVRSGTLQMLQNADFRVREAEAMVGLPTSSEREEKLPERMRALGVELFGRGEVSESRLSRLFGCDILVTRRIIDDLSGESELFENGQPGWLDIPLQETLEGTS